jgi:hypothetical protein
MKTYRKAKGETLFSFEIIPPQKEKYSRIVIAIDCLMSSNHY